MKKLAIVLAAAAAVTGTAVAGGNEAYTASDREISGTFEFQGTTYRVSVGVDQVRYRNGSSHRVWIVPEANKKEVSPTFSGPGFKVRCPFDSPGVQSYRGSNITCTWKAGNGSLGRQPDRNGTVVLR